MTINHNDQETQHLFDVQWAAIRAGIEAVTVEHINSEFDRDYLIGMNAAIKRNPTAWQRALQDLAARFTVRIDEHGNKRLTPPADLDLSDADPVFVDRAKLIAYLDASDSVPVPVP
jgi:hypothetical protein